MYCRGLDRQACGPRCSISGMLSWWGPLPIARLPTRSPLPCPSTAPARRMETLGGLCGFVFSEWKECPEGLNAPLFSQGRASLMAMEYTSLLISSSVPTSPAAETFVTDICMRRHGSIRLNATLCCVVSLLDVLDPHQNSSQPMTTGHPGRYFNCARPSSFGLGVLVSYLVSTTLIPFQLLLDSLHSKALAQT